MTVLTLFNSNTDLTRMNTLSKVKTDNTLQNFSPDSRVWIYQSSREFTDAESTEINAALHDFAHAWTSHGRHLKAHAELRYNRFVIVIVDEQSGTNASGCSIDASVHFLKKLEQKYNTDLFDRLTFYYKKGDAIKSVNNASLITSINAGKITPDTLFFNNIVNTKRELDNQWLIPLKNTWMMRKV